MRVRTLLVLGSSVFLLGVSSLASARPKQKSTTPAAPVETAAARAARLALADDVGERKDADLHAPAMVNGQVSTGEASPDRAPDATAAAQPVRPDGPLSGAMEELVGRQLGRNRAVQASVEKCLTEAKSRDSHFSGVEVTVRVVGKDASFEAGKSEDAALVTCLAGVRGLKLSIPDQSFSWRFSPSDHREMATR